MVSEQRIHPGQIAEMREIVAALGNEAMGANMEGLEVSFEGCAKRHAETVNLVGSVALIRL